MKRLTVLFAFLGLLMWLPVSAQNLAKPLGSQAPTFRYALPDFLAKGQIIFTEDFSTWPPTGWTFVNASGSPGFINGNGYAFHNDDRADCADYMISPAISLPENADTILMTFSSYENYSSYYVKHSVILLDGNDPSTANVIDTIFEGVTAEDTWVTVNINLTPYSGDTVYIAFYYEGNYADEWSIDNIIIFAPDSLDVTPVAILPENFVPNTDLNASYIIYQNFGYSSFSDTLAITLQLLQNDDVLYTKDTVIIDSLGSLETHTLFLPVSIPALDPGMYSWKAIIKSDIDQDPNNDTLVVNFDVTFPNYDAQYGMYGYVAFDTNNAYNNKFVNINPSTGDIDSLTNGLSSPFGATFIQINEQNVMLGMVNNSVAILSPMDGKIKNIMPLRSLPDTINVHTYGLAYDATSNLLYTVGYAYSSGRTYNFLFSFDLTNFEVNYIDSIPGAKAMLAIAFDNQGNLYGIDLSSDALYSIDKNTASAQKVGDLGVSISYLQDITFNPTNNTLYGALFNYSYYTGATAGIYTISTTNGSATLIKDNACEITALAFKYGVSTNAVEHTPDFSIMPNPTTDYLIISNIETPSQVSVIDINGKILQNITVKSNNQRIDVSDLQPGIYLLKIMTTQGIKTFKFIKK